MVLQGAWWVVPWEGKEHLLESCSVYTVMPKPQCQAGSWTRRLIPG